jgi:hypothetical protein
VTKHTSDPRAEKIRKFRLHAILFLAALVIMIPVNFVVSPANPWWMYFAFAWALPLFAHWLYAQEIVGGRR